MMKRLRAPLLTVIACITVPALCLEPTEERILSVVLRDLHVRVTQYVQQFDEPTALHVLDQTEPWVDLRYGEWLIQDDPADLDHLLRGIPHEERRASLPVRDLAETTGFSPVALDDLRLHLRRSDHTGTLIELIDGTGFDDPSRLHIVFSETRPARNSANTHAMVLVANPIADWLNFVYYLKIDGAQVEIVWIATPQPSC